MKTKLLKRSLAFILSLALALSLMPTFAFASDGAITVNFNKTTMTATENSFKLSDVTVNENAGWDIVRDESNKWDVAGYPSSFKGDTGLWLQILINASLDAETWINASAKKDAQFAFNVKNVKEGWYNIKLTTIDHPTKGANAFLYANGNYVGSFTCASNTGTEDVFEKVYLTPDENSNVKFMIAKVSDGDKRFIGLSSLVLTPTTAPSAKSVLVKNTSGAEIENVNLANGESLDFTAQAFLDNVAVNYNGYTNTANDDNTTIAVSVDGDAVTFTNDRTNYTDEVLNGKLTAVKVGTATVTLTATYGDRQTAEKSITVNVARAENDPYVLEFNSSTMKEGANTSLDKMTVAENAGWSFARNESCYEVRSGAYTKDCFYFTPYLTGPEDSEENWFTVAEKRRMQFAIRMHDVAKAGWYDMTINYPSLVKGAGIYVYVSDNYVGYYDSSKEGPVTFKNVYLNPNAYGDVKIMLARVTSGTARYVGLSSMTFTPVTTAPDATTINTTLPDSIELENGKGLDFTAQAFLGDTAVNYSGYRVSTTEDVTTIKVEVTGDAVTFTNDRTNYTDELLNGKLTAVKSGTATVTITANLPGGKTATKTVTVTVLSTNDPDISNAFTTETPVVTQYNPTVSAAGYNASEGTATVEGITEKLQSNGSYKMYAPEKSGDAKFLYWAKGLSLNKKIVSYDNEFYYTPAGGDNNILIAVYDGADSASNKAEFYNANGQLIKLITTESEDKTVPALPSMAGYNSAISWKQYNGDTEVTVGENIRPEGTMIFVAQYELKEPAEVTVTVVDGNGTVTVPYGEEVTCTPDASKGVFKWWKKEVNGVSEIVSIDETYKFLAWEKCTVTAKYGSEKPEYTGNKMKIIIDSFKVGNTENGIMAEFIGFGTDAVEKGVMVGTNKIAMTRPGNQFTVTGEVGDTFKGYAIVKDDTGYKLIVDGEVTISANE